ncbi:MAG: carbohydrate-binding family 9-like protein [Butyricicoccus pullicaecorum]|nr:carbohydrate-binding family 9-like protein [Butyricicoccus pullicaecorum]
MKKSYRLVSGVAAGVLAVGLVGAAQAADAPAAAKVYQNQAATPHYDIAKRTDKATVDGKLDDGVWKTVAALSGDFHFPWDAKEAPLTVFKGYHDGTNFYFGFEITDADVVVEEAWKADESTVDAEDRAELFFAGGSVDKPTPKGMPLYYGIEIDPKGRVHDYSIEYYRKFDSKWNLNGLETKGAQTDTGYVVEGKVPLKSLQDLGLIQNDVMRAGVYRAEFSAPKKGEKDPVMEWISWVDPKTEAPDYHVDSSFGEFRFLK